MYQKILFNPEEIFKEPLKKYEMFFSLLNLSYLEPVKNTLSFFTSLSWDNIFSTSRRLIISPVSSIFLIKKNLLYLLSCKFISIPLLVKCHYSLFIKFNLLYPGSSPTSGLMYFIYSLVTKFP